MASVTPRAGFQPDHTSDPFAVVFSEVVLVSLMEILADSLVPKVVGLPELGGADPRLSMLGSSSEAKRRA